MKHSFTSFYRPMKKNTLVMLIVILMTSCNTPHSRNDSARSEQTIEGTWKLISGTTITGTDTAVTDYTKNQSMIKIINKTHFAFLRHDLTAGKDTSAIYESGGGHYTLSGNQYTEYLDYCNHREWEGSAFQFTVSIKNDSLIQQGIEKVEKAGVDRVIIETYTRAKE